MGQVNSLIQIDKCLRHQDKHPLIKEGHHYYLAKDIEFLQDGETRKITVKHPLKKGKTLCFDTTEFSVTHFQLGNFTPVKKRLVTDNLLPKHQNSTILIDRPLPKIDPDKVIPEAEKKKLSVCLLEVTEIIFSYSLRCADYCRDNRLSEYKKLGVSVKEHYSEFFEVLSSALVSDKHDAEAMARRIQGHARLLREKLASRLNMLELNAGNVALKLQPGTKVLELLKYAITGIGLCGMFGILYKEWKEKVNGEEAENNCLPRLERHFYDYLQIAGIGKRKGEIEFGENFEICKRAIFADIRKFDPEEFERMFDIIENT